MVLSSGAVPGFGIGDVYALKQIYEIKLQVLQRPEKSFIMQKRKAALRAAFR
jgi:hypothetical protein